MNLVHNSTYVWKYKKKNVTATAHFNIEGKYLFLLKTDVPTGEFDLEFQCELKVDPELGPITLDFFADPFLITEAFKKNIIEEDEYSDYVYHDEAQSDCIGGRNCEPSLQEQVRSF